MFILIKTIILALTFLLATKPVSADALPCHTFSCQTPASCPPEVAREQWPCCDSWAKCGTGNLSCSSSSTCSDNCCAGGGLNCCANAEAKNISSPANGASFIAGQTVNISGTVKPNAYCKGGWNGLDFVKLFIGSTTNFVRVPIKDQSGGSWEAYEMGYWSYSWTAITGTHDLFFTFFDGDPDGLYNCESNHVSIMITPPLTPIPTPSLTPVPTITSTPTPSPMPVPPSPTPTPECICGDYKDWHCGNPCGDQACDITQKCQVQFCYLTVTSNSCGTHHLCKNDPSCSSSGWFQTESGDVHSQGSLKSIMTNADDYFSQEGESGSAGVVSCLDSQPEFGQGKISSPRWLVNPYSHQSQIYDYSYFETNFDVPMAQQLGNIGQTVRLDGSQIEGTNIFTAPIWKINGDLQVDNINDSDQTIVFLVNGKVIINNDLDLNNALVTFISNGAIEINPLVHQLKGILLVSDSLIKTGDVKEDQTLNLKGAAISWGGFALQRKRDNNDEPAEIFAFHSEAIIRLEPILAKPKYIWEEVAP